jgi:probable O-glycosylation ligase (exosortase A-associated)
VTGLESTALWWRPEARATAEAGAAAPAVPASGAARTAFAGLLAFTAILIVSPQAWVPLLGTLRVALLAAGIAIGAELLDRAMTHRPLQRTPAAFKLVFALVSWAVLTVPLSYWPGGSVAALTDHFLKAIAFFWLIATVITSRGRLRSFLWLLALASLPLSLTALQNYASGSFLRAPGGVPRIAGYTTAGSGLAANPNDLALMINLLLPFAAALLVTTRRLLPRLVAGSALLLGVAGVIVTFSRAGFLTLAAMGLVGLLALGRRRPLALLVVAVVIAVATTMLPQGYFERLSTITDIESDTTGSAQGRWSDALVAMEVAARNPITGVGLDQNVLALNRERGATWREVHNVYLQYAVDLGVPGLTLFLALFVSLFRTAARVRRAGARRRDGREVAVAAGSVQVALVAFAVAAFFHPVAYQFYFFLAAGMALAVQNVLRAEMAAPRGCAA